jgi:hypothetical protein
MGVNTQQRCDWKLNGEFWTETFVRATAGTVAVFVKIFTAGALYRLSFVV